MQHNVSEKLLTGGKDATQSRFEAGKVISYLEWKFVCHLGGFLCIC